MKKDKEIEFKKILCPDCKEDNVTLLSESFDFTRHSGGVLIPFRCDICKSKLTAVYKLVKVRKSGDS